MPAPEAAEKHGWETPGIPLQPGQEQAAQGTPTCPVREKWGERDVLSDLFKGIRWPHLTRFRGFGERAESLSLHRACTKSGNGCAVSPGEQLSFQLCFSCFIRLRVSNRGFL